MISVIIPIYNHAFTLKQSAQSLIMQTYRPLEVIMVNDGSTDGSGFVAEEVKETLTGNGIRASVLRQQNKGAAAARNRGFREAKGDFVIFWDADTIGKPEMLKKMADILVMHPRASYAYSRFKFGWKTIKSHEFDTDLLKKMNYIDTTSLIRRTDFSGFDESLKRFQDWDLWLTMLEQGKTGIFVPEALFKKITEGRKGMSSWMPSFLYRLPWKTRKVKEYERARMVVMTKHGWPISPL